MQTSSINPYVHIVKLMHVIDLIYPSHKLKISQESLPFIMVTILNNMILSN
jgi:hypothetical protein